MMALLGLLSLMMLASTNPLHPTSLDASATMDDTTLVPVDDNQVSLPVNKKQLSEPIARRDDPGPPAPTPTDPPAPGPGQNIVDYNLRNPNFRIPPFVLCPRDANIVQGPQFGWPGGRQNPRYGGRALEPIFSANEVWAAFNVSTLPHHQADIHAYITANVLLARLAASHGRWPRWWLRS